MATGDDPGASPCPGAGPCPDASPDTGASPGPGAAASPCPGAGTVVELAWLVARDGTVVVIADEVSSGLWSVDVASWTRARLRLHKCKGQGG